MYLLLLLCVFQVLSIMNWVNFGKITEVSPRFFEPNSLIFQIIGVEMISEAVRDARKNATNNGISNCTFFSGKAENILVAILRDIDR